MPVFFDNCTLTTEEDPKRRKVGKTENEKNKEIRKDRRVYEFFKHTLQIQKNAEINKEKIKLQRAYGGCLGTKRRRRTWPTAKSCGEL